MKRELKGFLVIGTVFLLWTGVVYGGTIGNSITGFVNGVFTGWLNSTNINAATEYYYKGANYTAFLVSLMSGGTGHVHDQDLNTTDDVIHATLDTGQGANELYDMDQNVQTTDNVTFNQVNVTTTLRVNGTEFTANSTGVYINGTIIEDGPFNYTAATEDNGVTLGPRSRLNFIEGANITLNLVDDPANDQVNITITSTGGAGASGSSDLFFGASYIFKQNATSTYVLSGYNGSILANGADAGALLNTYATSGEDVYMLPGDYLITSKVALSGVENLTIRGGGKGTRFYQSGTNHNPIVGLSNCKAIQIEDIFIDGNLTGEATAYGIQIFNTNDTIIQNCYIANVETHGICFLNNSYNNLVDGCVVWDNGYDGIFGTHGASTPTIQRSIISNNMVYNNGRDGISANWGVKWSMLDNKLVNNTRWNLHTCGAPMCQMTGNELYWSGDDNIYITTATSGETVVSDNYIEGAGAEGIDIAAGDFLTISGNLIVDVPSSAIKTVGTTNTAIDSNTIYNCSTGIYTSTGTGISITGNTLRNITSSHGITPVQCTGMSIIGNTLETIAQYGIYLDRTDDSVVDGNNLISYSSVDNQYNGLRLSDADDNQITDNTFRQGDGSAYYAIYIDALALRNIIIDNDLRGGGSLSALINNYAPSTIYDVITFQFTEALGGNISTYSPTGIFVTTTSEEALAWGQIPLEVQCVKRIKIWGVALGAPIGAGGQMHLEITFNAGAANAAYNTATKSWSISDFDGEEANYVANDVVWWNIEDTDCGSELRNLEGGDSFEIFVTYNNGAEPDGETYMVVRCVEIEYV